MAKRDVVRRIDFDGYAGASPKGVTPTGGLTADQIQDMINDAIEENNNSGGGGATPVISMTVTPSTALSASGYVGGSFSGSVVYTLTNTSSVSITWTILKNATWFTLTSSTGTLAAGASTTVTAAIDGTAAAALAKGEYVDLMIFNAGSTTVASRMAQLSVREATLDDYIKSVSVPVDGTGGTVTLTMPTVADGDQVIALVRLEGISLTITDTDSFSNTTGGVYDYWSSDTPPSGTTGVTLVSLMRYAAATDSGDSFSIDVDDGGSPFSGAYTVIIIVLNENPLVNYVDFFNGVQWEPTNYHAMEVDVTGYNNLMLFVSVGYTDGALGFNTFPTALAQTANMYVGAKVYPNPVSFGMTDIATITAVPCYVSEAFWMYSVSATS